MRGRATAQAVSRRPPTAEARVRSRVSPCGVCGGQSGTETGFSPRVLRFSPVNFIPPLFHYLEQWRNWSPFSSSSSQRFAQEALRLRCVRSFCCGALLPSKKTHMNSTLSKYGQNCTPPPPQQMALFNSSNLKQKAAGIFAKLANYNKLHGVTSQKKIILS
jgi:hypothetical protein